MHLNFIQYIFQLEGKRGWGHSLLMTFTYYGNLPKTLTTAT